MVLRAAVVVAGMLVLAACGASAEGTTERAPSATALDVIGVARAQRAGARGTSRLAPEDAAALARLAYTSAARVAAGPVAGDGGHVHDAGPTVEVPLAADDQATFDEQWRRAQAATAALTTPDDAAAAGYVKASAYVAGVGSHWIRWSLVDAPFDPARPSMLLYDDGPGRIPTLVGFSYWVRADGPPDGFAGPNDHWHRHAGLCFVDGWLEQEDVPSPAACAGQWLDGSDLWMLHAWVVPGREDRLGRFADTNPSVCPPRTRVPDVSSCSPDRGS